MRASAGALLLAGALACQRAPEPCPALVSDGQYEMGTVLEIQLCAADRASGERLLASAFARVAALEHSFSTFDPESEVSRLNRSAGSGPQPVSLELLRLSVDSLVLADQTQRSFDPTVGPLVALWREAGRAGRLPSAAALADARAHTGFDVVQADLPAKTIELRVAGASLDFGGIAKGWALDRLVEDLRAAGVTRALLSFGDSSLAALGAPANADGWGIALGNPSGGVAGTVLLRDQSLSISGSLGQWSEIQGRRYGHVIDPRSGAPLERERIAAVLASNGARAEALSKALLILGERDGVALLEGTPDAQGILLDADGGAFETRGWREAARYLR